VPLLMHDGNVAFRFGKSEQRVKASNGKMAVHLLMS